MAQLVEHILGKDEVPGSNPGISLRSTPVVRKYDRGISFSGGSTERSTEYHIPVLPILHYILTFLPNYSTISLLYI